MSKASRAPGSYQPGLDLWGDFDALCRERLPGRCVALVDVRVAMLHPNVVHSLERAGTKVLRLRAGENTKSLRVLEKVLAATTELPRSGTLMVVGGGTLGDLGTVAAHLIKRGVRLIQVPSTLLAAVDSSSGGKGAVHAATRDEKGRSSQVKNAVGAFHYADETWLCERLFETLKPRQLREGRIEAFKMFATLKAPLWRKHAREEAPLGVLVRDARALKAAICKKDPYEKLGLRPVLNFGHTFGHVLESLSHFRISHGDAVGLGMLCALDVGRRMKLTPDELAKDVETALVEGPGVLPRDDMASVFADADAAHIEKLLVADKKTSSKGELKMVLLRALGKWELVTVPAAIWQSLLPSWQNGERPKRRG